MTNSVTKALAPTMEDHVENCFNEFMKEYELDIEGSLEDMLFEFFAEGFIQAVVDEEEEEA